MLTELKRILASSEFESSFGNVDLWTSVQITYRHPHVDRLWRQIGSNRLFLHRIHPVPDVDAMLVAALADPANDSLRVSELRIKVGAVGLDPLWHPHAWPSAMYIVSGHYRMDIGVAGEMLASIELPPESFYEMVNPNTFHSVSPLYGQPVWTVMLTGEPWPKGERVEFPKPVHAQPEMDRCTAQSFLDSFEEQLLESESHTYCSKDGNAEADD